MKKIGLGILLLAASLFGAVTMGTVEAQTGIDMSNVPVSTWTPQPSWLPDESGTYHTRGTPEYDALMDARNPAESARPGAGDVDLGGVDVLSCSLTDGCSLPVAITTEDGEILKLMVITFEDMPEAKATATP